MIIDYSLWRPKIAADLAGVDGVIRYLSRDSAKAISGAELAQLHEWGIATALVYEDAAQRALQGAAAGTEDGKMCGQAMRTLGVPAGRPVYVALDWDVADYAPGGTNPLAKLGPVADYLEAFEAAIKQWAYATGVYGGYWPVNRALSAGLTSWGWQTIAWSPQQAGLTQQDPRIRLYQTGVQILSGNADLNFAGARDWGQFRRFSGWLTGAPA